MTKSSDERSKSLTRAATDPVVTFGSLFAGIGGFDLGFERAGMNCQWQVEIDDYANRVLAKHWPNVHRERDILQCGGHNLEPVDVICGGFPCQDISYAGRGAGLDGERSGLFFEAIRVVRELRPRIVVLENVAALLTRGLDRVLGTLAEIGFDAEWHCIPAAAVGAPHERERYFIVAYVGGVGICGRGTDSETQHSSPILHRGGRNGDEFCETGSRSMETRGNSKRAVSARWRPEPDVGRVVHGVPARVDRIRGLGNAVVPQVAEFVAREFVLPMFQSEHTECT